MPAQPADVLIDEHQTTFRWPIALARLAIGLAQGLALYALIRLRQDHAWPATQSVVFAPLLMIVLMAPMIPLAGIGRTRPVTLAAWALIGAAVIALFGLFDRMNALTPPAGVWQDPEPEMVVFLASIAFLFIGHHLITPADAARRWLAPYADYFDDASMNAVRVGLSVAFVGVLWLALFLGSALFSLIGIRAFEQLLQKEWFAFPVSTLAFAAAVQLTDVRIGLIRGVRTVALVLLAWLLPIATLIAGGFLVALPFTGLAPLFATRSATAILLSAAAGLIVLLNAAYQDGEGRTPRVLKAVGLAAAVEITPLIGIAAYALGLRIGQHGFTPERVWALACVVIGAGFAIGYLIAVILSRRGWMKPLERTNIVMGVVALIVLVALFTPIADPSRISVNSQLARLADGRVTPDQFDFRFLQTGAGRRGEVALERLRHAAQTPRDRLIAAAAERALVEAQGDGSVPINPAQQFTVYPAHHALPAGFPPAGGSPNTEYRRQVCDRFCDAYLVDVDGDGTQEVLVTPRYRYVGPETRLDLHRLEGGQWRFVGAIDVCTVMMPDMMAGRFSFEPAQGRELAIGNRRFRVAMQESCPPPPTVTVPAAPPGATPER